MIRSSDTIRAEIAADGTAAFHAVAGGAVVAGPSGLVALNNRAGLFVVVLRDGPTGRWAGGVDSMVAWSRALVDPAGMWRADDPTAIRIPADGAWHLGAIIEDVPQGADVSMYVDGVEGVGVTHHTVGATTGLEEADTMIHISQVLRPAVGARIEIFGSSMVRTNAWPMMWASWLCP